MPTRAVRVPVDCAKALAFQAQPPFRLLPSCLTATAFVSGALLCNQALADSCIALALVRSSSAVVQIREPAQDERTAVVYRDESRSLWFLPLRSERAAQPGADRIACQLDGQTYWRVRSNDPALRHDSEQDLLSFVDTSQATHSIDARRPQQALPTSTLDSVGVNYQLALAYAGSTFNPTATGDFYAYRQGWYLSTGLAWNRRGKVTRYESYALKESLETGTFLRLGDSTTSPTARGEALQFGGVSWGTDRNLRPYDFSPVLPTLRNGNVLASPIDVFINDTLQFQQTLQSGVYDVRNVPALQGFNSYRVRTVDAQGNPVTVQREIYLPASLLPPGISSWRVDAGLLRQDFFGANASYGAPLVAGSYAIGLDHDTTVGGQALVSKAASIGSIDYDRRLSALWTGHLGLHAARNTRQQGQAIQARVDGGGRWWRLLADWTHSFKPLPGLGERTALLSQRLLRAQWNGLAGWTFSLTRIQSSREFSAPESVATVSATTRVTDSGTTLSVDVTHIRSTNASPTNVSVSLLVPLAAGNEGRNRSVYASQSNADGFNYSRLQYSSSGQQQRDSSWGVGVTHDSRQAMTSLDSVWSGSTDKLELLASARAMQGDFSGLLSLRSGLLWTGGSMFTSRPVTGAFAMVSTGEKDVEVFYENRLAGRTDERGLLLVPDLLPLQQNRLNLNPATWPIHWLANRVDTQVVPPRGGGVLVSFKISAQVWPAQTMMTPLDPDGSRYPPGTVVYGNANGETLDTIVDRSGQLWISALLPATSFYIKRNGTQCDFTIPQLDGGAEIVLVSPAACKDSP